MTIKESADPRAGAAYVKRPVAGALAAAALVAVASLGATRLAAADEPQRKGWWLDAGMGASELSAPNDGIVDGGGGFWVDLMIGGRLNDRWLMGFDLGGSAMHPGGGGSNCGCYGSNNSYWGEGISHSMLAVRYVPAIDHGWVWGLAGGAAFYNNQNIENYTGNYNTGSGWAADAVIGYDWLLSGPKTHIEAVLNVEQGHISYAAPLTGRFEYSQVAVSVHIAWF